MSKPNFPLYLQFFIQICVKFVKFVVTVVMTSYSSWEKYDVDSALKDVDEASQKNDIHCARVVCSSIQMDLFLMTHTIFSVSINYLLFVCVVFCVVCVYVCVCVFVRNAASCFNDAAQ